MKCFKCGVIMEMRHAAIQVVINLASLSPDSHKMQKQQIVNYCISKSNALASFQHLILNIVVFFSKTLNVNH